MVDLVCSTNDMRDRGCHHAYVPMKPEEAKYLLTLRAAFLEIEKVSSSVYCIELWNGWCEWGRLRNYTSVDGIWERTTQDLVFFEKEASTELGTIKVMSDGVLFSAMLKNDEPAVYFETAVLSWDVIQRIAQDSSVDTYLEPANIAFEEDSEDD